MLRVDEIDRDVLGSFENQMIKTEFEIRMVKASVVNFCSALEGTRGDRRCMRWRLPGSLLLRRETPNLYWRAKPSSKRDAVEDSERPYHRKL